jgi:predicted enzyme related to lactoylglutathione lyase
MSISGLDLLFIEVNNIEESLHFYSGMLGFQVARHNPDSEPPMATLQVGTLKITLAQHLETMLRRGRGVNFFLGVDDVDQYYRELKQRGADVRPPVDEGWGGRFITLQDPDKYRFFFVTWADSESDTHLDQKSDSKEYLREEAAKFLD